ncbi:hypothetical protein FOZ63_025004, partial [Perkinsus olseni]
YHTGTIAWGSLLTMILRPLRILFFLVEWALDGPTNTVITSTLAKRLSYSLKFHRRFLKFICEDAYIDVAFNSSSFLAAGANAFKVMHTDTQLSRTILMFLCVGVVVSAVFGGYVAHMVSSPFLVSTICSFLGGVLSMSSMALLRATADSLLYCSSVNQPNPGYRDHAPVCLRETISSMRRSVYADVAETTMRRVYAE